MEGGRWKAEGGRQRSWRRYLYTPDIDNYLVFVWKAYSFILRIHIARGWGKPMWMSGWMDDINPTQPILTAVGWLWWIIWGSSVCMIEISLLTTYLCVITTRFHVLWWSLEVMRIIQHDCPLNLYVGVLLILKSPIRLSLPWVPSWQRMILTPTAACSASTAPHIFRPKLLYLLTQVWDISHVLNINNYLYFLHNCHCG